MSVVCYRHHQLLIVIDKSKRCGCPLDNVICQRINADWRLLISTAFLLEFIVPTVRVCKLDRIVIIKFAYYWL